MHLDAAVRRRMPAMTLFYLVKHRQILGGKERDVDAMTFAEFRDEGIILDLLRHLCLQPFPGL